MDTYPLLMKGLVIGIILLFIGTGIIPSTAQDTEKTSLPTSTGKNQCFDTTPVSLSTSPILCAYNKAIQKLFGLCSNALTFCDLSEENIIHKNEFTTKELLFGFAFIDGVITDVEQHDNSYHFACKPVKRVTVIGIIQTPKDYSSNLQFFGTFTNATNVYGWSSKKLFVSDEYQHFSTYVIPSLIKPINGLIINFYYG